MSDVDPLIGRQLASFRIDRVQGRGGMATVYYGWDVKLERPVALKVIATNYAGDAAYAARFVNEARAISTWHHPNILQVYYADDADGLYYFVMEYIEGQDLGARLDEFRRQGQHMPAREVLRIGRAVANALDYAHERGVIHRDVKPANVMVAEDGRVVLADFGIAMNVSQGTMGTVFGSPHYFSPEQARSSADVVPQSDLYSLGIMLYEMLTGRVPFDDPSPVSLAMQQINREPPPPRSINPALSPGVESVLLKALQKQPQDRFQTGRQLMDALGLALDIPEPTLPFLERPSAPASRPPAPALSQRLAPVLAAAGDDVRRAGRAIAPIVAAAQPAAKRGLTSLAHGLQSAWSWFRAHPTTRAVVHRLRQDPAARIVAGGAALLILAAFFIRLPAPNFAVSDTGEPTVEATTAAATAAPVDPEATPAPTAEPVNTPVPGQGEHFVAIYDDTGFYLKNETKNDRPIGPVAFERVLGDGTFANRFNGSHWSQIYPTIRAGRCTVLEIINYPNHLDPKECKNKFVVYRSPDISEPFIFWTNQEGSTQFRALWSDAEVGRCDIAAGRCDLYLP